MAGRYSFKSIWEDLALGELALSFKLAIGPNKLLLAFGAVVATCLLGFLMDQCSQNVIICSQDYPQYGLTAGQTELDLYIQNPLQTGAFIDQLREAPAGIKQGLFFYFVAFYDFSFSSRDDAITKFWRCKYF